MQRSDVGLPVLKKGEYTMVELPEGHGLHDCKLAEVQAQGAEPLKDTKLGEYCRLSAK